MSNCEWYKIVKYLADECRDKKAGDKIRIPAEYGVVCMRYILEKHMPTEQYNSAPTLPTPL
jgi:hypothetical protein